MILKCFAHQDNPHRWTLRSKKESYMLSVSMLHAQTCNMKKYKEKTVCCHFSDRGHRLNEDAPSFGTSFSVPIIHPSFLLYSMCCRKEKETLQRVHMSLIFCVWSSSEKVTQMSHQQLTEAGILHDGSRCYDDPMFYINIKISSYSFFVWNWTGDVGTCANFDLYERKKKRDLTGFDVAHK